MVNLYKRSIVVIIEHFLPSKLTYITTKLYGKSARGCNNNTNMQKKATGFYRFMLSLLNLLFFGVYIYFLPDYRVKYYDYIVKWFQLVISVHS